MGYIPVTESLGISSTSFTELPNSVK